MRKNRKINQFSRRNEAEIFCKHFKRTTLNECSDQVIVYGSDWDTEINLVLLDPQFITDNALRLKSKSKYLIVIWHIIHCPKTKNYKILKITKLLYLEIQIGKFNRRP
ncbi:hypothetical protein CEXT_404231 [Caerostris extrusa]|uniref:Uncharacterized protein n=1 Tax=Caerostris extrusa TaxID=172846 RepID=A0AAV4Q0L3_CAEEX|nr:hypothetical protein CEXT_404231 [Caerostris extrusa]